MWPILVVASSQPATLTIASRFISHPIHRRHWRKPAHRDSRSCSPRGCTSPVRARPAVFTHVKHRFFLLPPPPPMGCARVSDETHRGMWEAAEAEAISTARLSHPRSARAAAPSPNVECTGTKYKVRRNCRTSPSMAQLQSDRKQAQSAVTRGISTSKPRSQT